MLALYVSCAPSAGIVHLVVNRRREDLRTRQLAESASQTHPNRRRILVHGQCRCRCCVSHFLIPRYLLTESRNPYRLDVSLSGFTNGGGAAVEDQN
jgi:hypothetical protein